MNPNIFKNTIRFYIAKQRYFTKNRCFQRLITAQHNDIGMNPHALQFFYRMLRRLCFVLLRAVQIRNERHVDEEAVFTPDLKRDLTHRLDERLGFYVADRAANLGDDNVRVRVFADVIYKVLYLVRNMGDDLYRGA